MLFRSLVVEDTEAGPQVRAHVGSGGDFDEEDDLEAEIEIELDELRLEYNSWHERAWLISDDHGNLCGACRRVAALATLVIEQLRVAADLHAPVTSYEERLQQHGPWSWPASAGHVDIGFRGVRSRNRSASVERLSEDAPTRLGDV